MGMIAWTTDDTHGTRAREAGARSLTPARGGRGSLAVLATIAAACLCLATCLALLGAGPARARAAQPDPGAEAAVAPATSATAPAGAVDPALPCRISLRDCQVDGQTFTAWRVASMGEDGTLTAVDALAPAVAQTGIDPAGLAGAPSSDLRAAALSYEGYVAADPDAFQSASAVASGGAAEITGLEPGLYLLRAATMTVDGTTYTSDPYLVALPQTDEDGAYVYEGTVSADKVTVARVRHHENVVTKVWSGDDPAARPQSVQVQIYDGTTLAAQVELNAENGWTYAWEGEGDWSVREVMDGMDGYASTVGLTLTLADESGAPVPVEELAEGLAGGGVVTDTLQTAFTVTNTSRTPVTPSGTTPSGGSGGSVPKTGDQTDWLPVGALAALGVCGVALGTAALVRRARRGRTR